MLTQVAAPRLSMSCSGWGHVAAESDISRLTSVQSTLNDLTSLPAFVSSSRVGIYGLYKPFSFLIWTLLAVCRPPLCQRLWMFVMEQKHTRANTSSLPRTRCLIKWGLSIFLLQMTAKSYLRAHVIDCMTMVIADEATRRDGIMESIRYF